MTAIPTDLSFLKRQVMRGRDAYRTEHFQANCLAWVALRHFLPASLIRELSYVLVDVVSGGDMSLEGLFKEELIEGVDCLDSWILEPLEVVAPLADYLQRRVRYLVWQHDAGTSSQADTKASDEKIGPAAVENAVLIGKADLGVTEGQLEELRTPHQESFNVLISAIKRMTIDQTSISAETALETIEEACGVVEMPLRAVILKHIGDLCGDADEWEKALVFYGSAMMRLSNFETAHWIPLVRLLKDAILQSRSAGLWMTKGPNESATLLTERLRAMPLADARLFHLNASQDAYIATSLANERFAFPSDRRASSLLPPQLLKSYSIESAMANWLEENYAGAHPGILGSAQASDSAGFGMRYPCYEDLL
jgi:hypothetical protein